MGEGIISLDQEETNYDAMPSAQKHVQVIKQVLIFLLKKLTPELNYNFQFENR